MNNYKTILEDMRMNVIGLDGYKKHYYHIDFINLVIKVTGIDCFGDAVDYLIEKKGFNL